MKPSKSLLFTGASLLLCLSTSVHAVDRTWTSGATGVFDDAAMYGGTGPSPTGDNVIANGNFTIGYGSGLTYTLGTLILSGTSGQGNFNQTGGTLTTGTLFVGRTSSDAGGASRVPAFNLSGGIFNTGAISFGNGSNTATGAPIAGTRINQTAGTFNYTGTGSLSLGGATTGQSSINVSGGTFNAASATLIFLGNGGTDAKGQINLSNDAAFNAGAATLVLGQQGNASAVGTVNMSGTSTMSVANVVIGGNNAAFAASGVFNLNGGTITTGSIRKGNSSTTPSATANAFHANGGTVKVATHANNSNFFQNAYVNIKNGGLKFDTNGNATTITNNLNGDAVSTGGGLTKQGNGTLTLTGATATYTGATVISGGTLKLGATGTLGNTSGLSLGTAGTFDVADKVGGYTINNLSGSGAVIGSLTVSTLLAIGNSPGTVDFENLTLAASSTYLYELNGGTTGTGSADLGNVSGTLDLTGATLDLVQLGSYTQGDVFTLFSYDTLVGTFAGLDEGEVFTDAGGEWRISYDGAQGTNGGTEGKFVTVTAVPEPAAVLLGSLGLMALLRRRKGN